LRAPPHIFLIADLSAVGCASDDIDSGDSFVGKFSRDESQLAAVKASLNPDFVEWIGQEAVVLKRLKYQLLLEFVGNISDTADPNSAIVTEFARKWITGTASLISRISFERCIQNCTSYH
jgi:hypothetical protein